MNFRSVIMAAYAEPLRRLRMPGAVGGADASWICALDNAVLKLDRLRDVVGDEQIERALWYSGPHLWRLDCAHDFLTEGRTLDYRGCWSPPRRMTLSGAMDLQDQLRKAAR